MLDFPGGEKAFERYVLARTLLEQGSDLCSIAKQLNITETTARSLLQSAQGI